ncbi:MULTISPECIES: hypothetical protein [Micromonospora]|uniref:PknH-like extracellular domain-containing protein n=1 Tax=Micromonospora solifontis TaxID=2487138 RepID=A0ABX9WLE7_9ACTN|nr:MULTISPECIES: hypothetical protein [Micromonospora]NES14348.1 hypothetical protein [Micromonospora sp. PPF5-17B]NES35044.1 hypothetical protein [Micromonospora solifontis]NES57456.1 hypothetical protein [Micromonospora sp. PPF5-6]RNM01315.1 hypothetical protein EFE23_02505 [Micromonospora solifontis]
MRDEDLTFVELVQRDLQTVRWLDAAELRARARRRGRHQAVGAAVVVLVLLSASAAAAAGLPGWPGRPTVAGPAASPTSRAEIPRDALLQPEDLPEQVATPFTETGLGEPIVIDPEWTRCLKERKVSPTWEMSRYSRSESFWRGPRENRDMQLSQDVYRIGPELVATLSAGIDRRVRSCLDWEDAQTGPLGYGSTPGELVTRFTRHRWEVVARGFAGDEAMLIRHTTGETRREDAAGEVLAGAPEPQTVAVVRVGDLVTVFELGDWASEPDFRRLATVAARRMCVAANPPC